MSENNFYGSVGGEGGKLGQSDECRGFLRFFDPCRAPLCIPCVYPKQPVFRGLEPPPFGSIGIGIRRMMR